MRLLRRTPQRAKWWFSGSVAVCGLQAADKEGVTVFLRDLSARRNLEHDLERRNRVLSTRREISIDAVLLVDVNARISALRIRIFIDGFGTVYCSPRKIATLPKTH